MRSLWFCLLLINTGWGPIQLWGQELATTDFLEVRDSNHILLLRNAMDYHQALVRGDAELIKLRTSKKLRYAHSNGWIETQQQQIENIKTGYLIYHSYKEDSLEIYQLKQPINFNGVDPSLHYWKRHVTLIFNATIDVTLKGNRNTYLLRVSEVWQKKRGRGKGYQLVGRKAHH
ncbi:MAG: nuclear transport factor 2 family protein [Bacteroidetes bacterium]|nr:nuclear transport factor 2 family protein [Bacteroidota bacterium]